MTTGPQCVCQGKAAGYESRLLGRRRTPGTHIAAPAAPKADKLEVRQVKPLCRDEQALRLRNVVSLCSAVTTGKRGSATQF
jgi:hypothetical protein